LIFDPLDRYEEKKVNDTVKKGRQRIMVFQQNGSGERKISGLREYGGDLLELEIIDIDEVLPLVIDDTSEYLPKDVSCDLVLDFLRHNDLSTDLAAICEKNAIPLIASGKKITGRGIFAPPT
jgi:hypothetical protein